jgi:hypothetical protein
MLDADRGYFLEAQAFGGLDPTVARQNVSASVNHDGPEEPKVVDAFGELSNLSVAVKPWIPGIAL